MITPSHHHPHNFPPSHLSPSLRRRSLEGGAIEKQDDHQLGHGQREGVRSVYVDGKVWVWPTWCSELTVPSSTPPSFPSPPLPLFPSYPPLHPSVSGGELRGNMGEKAPKAPKPTESLRLISVTPREPLKHKKVQKQIH